MTEKFIIVAPSLEAANLVEELLTLEAPETIEGLTVPEMKLIAAAFIQSILKETEND